MIKCDVIQDLLPLYVDDVASKGSRAMVEEHIKSCKNCSEVLSKMQSGNNDINLNINNKEIGAFKTMKKKILRGHAIAAVVSALLVITAVISLAIHAMSAKVISYDFWLMGGIVSALVIFNVFFGLYNLKVTERVKTLSKLQYAIILFINILNTGNAVIHLIINIIIGAYNNPRT